MLQYATGGRPRPAGLQLRVVAASLGPAFVAAVAYVDPGNFATNFSAGAHFGYSLAWVIVAANAMAVLVQYLSAKVGLATGKDLPELCRENFPPVVSKCLWVQAEIVAMATDLAEFVGAAIGLNLVLRIPLPVAGVLTAIVAFLILGLQQRGYRPFELAIMGMLGVVLLGLGYDLVAVGVDAGQTTAGMVPHLGGPDSAQRMTLIAGIIGATVMPHVVYLHSALTKIRATGLEYQDRAGTLRMLRLDLLLGLGVAGLINLSMLLTAASIFHANGLPQVDSIEAAHTGLAQLVGGGAALAFSMALLASGLSSSGVGTYAGQVIMQGFIRRSIPLFVRRGLTMLPALVVLSLGLPSTQSLVISQVVLSFGIPFTLAPLILLTRRADILGRFANRRITTVAGSLITVIIALLNAYLLLDLAF